MPSLAPLTVVVPNFNHGEVIGRQLGAIFGQSIQPAKIIIIDDASTDRSAAIIDQLVSGREDCHVVYRAQNAGPVSAINQGMALSSTKFITFLAADDEILPGFFEKSMHLLEAHPQAAFCSGISRVRYGAYVTSEPLRHLLPSDRPTYLPSDRIHASLLWRDPWFSGPTVMWRRELLVAAGGFRPELRSYSDGFMYMACALRHGACFIPEHLASFNRSDQSYSLSVGRDDDGMAEVFVATNALIQSDFSKEFSSELRRAFNARFLYSLLVPRLRRFRIRALVLLSSVEPTASLRMAAIVIRLAAVLAHVLLLCALRPRDIPGAMRKVLVRGLAKAREDVDAR